MLSNRYSLFHYSKLHLEDVRAQVFESDIIEEEKVRIYVHMSLMITKLGELLYAICSRTNF